MKEYRTIKFEANDSFVERRSRFIGYAKPVTTNEEAVEFINEIKAKHWDATHNVYAYVLRDGQIRRYSDDGEPQGTSGAPMVQMLVKEEITNVVIVVTRYFGGIKLGTGGLVRAYTSSAKLGLEAAGICQVKEMAVMQFKVDYSYLSKIQNLAQGGLFGIEDIIYAADVTLKVVTEIENIEEIKTLFTNLTAGTAVLVSESTELTKKL